MAGGMEGVGFPAEGCDAGRLYFSVSPNGQFAICHRKNALFYKTQRGAQVGDLFMSLIHSCQFAGVNPLDYLTWLFRNAMQIPKNPHGFLPWNYQPP